MKKIANWLTASLDLFRSVNAQAQGIGLIKRLKIYWNVLRLRSAYALKKNPLVTSVNGYRMYLDIYRPGIGYELAIWREREQLDTYVVKEEIRPGMRVVDIGANVGYYTLLLAACVGNEGKIFAYEPFPANFHDLQRNISNNNLSDLVDAHQLAVSDKAGTAEFFIGAADNLGTMMDDSDYTGETKTSMQVQTTTLDLINQEMGPIDFLRMDIEGSELRVFDGMKKTFKQAIPPRILFEVHPEGDVDPDPRFTPYFEMLLNLGYLPKYVVSSKNPTALHRFAELGYTPILYSKEGQGLVQNLHPEHLIDVGARRRKITRSIYLIHASDKR